MEIATELRLLREEFRRVSNGQGFPRCAERLARIDALEKELAVIHKRIDNMNTRFWWAITFTMTTAIGLVIAFIKGGLTY